ncbi:hypothetical protein LJC01_02205 [Clostridiaceae bacterium OttesenSCG-928-D20]|nr:hypothetical protein [Clostridiaceae bacterium OttesenSCG-928-D20]
MSNIGFPTSSDIYLEAEGRKIAVVQSYKATATRTETVVEAFGEPEPVATIATQLVYKIELTRLYATDEAVSDGINFYSLSDFSLVIVKPDRRVVYTGCQWSKIQEDGKLSQMVAENISLIAAHRIETSA